MSSIASKSMFLFLLILVILSFKFLNMVNYHNRNSFLSNEIHDNSYLIQLLIRALFSEAKCAISF